jgi:hypothetical protein
MTAPEDLPRVEYEQDPDTGTLHPVDPDAAKSDHIIMWGGKPAAIIRVKSPNWPRVVQVGNIAVIP